MVTRRALTVSELLSGSLTLDLRLILDLILIVHLFRLLSSHSLSTCLF